MRDRLHLAWLQIIIVTKIMNKMLLPQKYQIPACPLRRRTRCQTGTAQPTATDNALTCYYHQRLGDKARLCRDPCAFALKLLRQHKVATLVSGEQIETQHDCAITETSKLSPSRLLYVTDKRNKCRYLIDMGAAVSVLPRSCANGTVDADSLPLVPANNSTITTYGTSKRIVDVGLKREYIHGHLLSPMLNNLF